MIVGIGVDLCQVSRLEAALSRRPGLADRLFTSAEQERPTHSLAGAFAAKEALAKSLGAPGLRWLDCEVVREESGQPRFRVTGGVAQRVADLGIGSIHLSISHDAGAAVAMVVCERLSVGEDTSHA